MTLKESRTFFNAFIILRTLHRQTGQDLGQCVCWHIQSFKEEDIMQYKINKKENN